MKCNADDRAEASDGLDQNFGYLQTIDRLQTIIDMESHMPSTYARLRTRHPNSSQEPKRELDGAKQRKSSNKIVSELFTACTSAC